MNASFRKTATLLLIFVTLPVAAQTNNPTKALRQMVATERAFSRTSEEKGIRESFTAFIADDGILFRPRAVPGKKWMQEHPLPPSTTRPLLTWQPIFAAISRAGDLGYTTGPWQYKNDVKEAKPAAFGNFMTVWKKQYDGTWKFVLDLGIDNPEPPAVPRFMSFAPPAGRFRRVNLPNSRAALVSAEKKFSQTSAERGAVEAFLAHAAPDVRVFRSGRQPFVGRKQAVRALPPLAISWSWVPGFSDVSASGDLGYSYGGYELREKSSGKLVESGNYARVWRKAGDVWKVVIDVANPVPPGQ